MPGMTVAEKVALSFLEIPETKPVEVIAMIGAQRPQAALAQRDHGQHPFEAGEE